MEEVEILTDTVVSLSALKESPIAAVASGNGLPVAVLKHDKPVFYCLTPENYEALLDKLDDLDLTEIAEQRAGGKTVRVSIDEL